MTTWKYFFRKFEEANLYQPSRELMFEAATLGGGIRDQTFKASDGTALHGWFAPVKDPKAWALLSHGNGGNISHRLAWLDLLARHQGLGRAAHGLARHLGRPDGHGPRRGAALAGLVRGHDGGSVRAG